MDPVLYRRGCGGHQIAVQRLSWLFDASAATRGDYVVKKQEPLSVERVAGAHLEDVYQVVFSSRQSYYTFKVDGG